MLPKVERGLEMPQGRAALTPPREPDRGRCDWNLGTGIRTSPRSRSACPSSRAACSASPASTARIAELCAAHGGTGQQVGSRIDAVRQPAWPAGEVQIERFGRRLSRRIIAAVEPVQHGHDR